MTKGTDIDYQALFEALPGHHIAVLPDSPRYTIVAQTKSHEKVAMVKRGEVIGKPFFEAFPDNTDTLKKTGKNPIRESFRQVIKTSKPHTMEPIRYDIKNTSGKFTAKYWQATHYPLFDAKGKLLLILQDTRDITEERSASSVLEATRKQLDQALSVGLIGTWEWDIKNDTIVADKNLAHMFGISPKQAKTGLELSVFIEAIHPDDRERVTRDIEAAIEQKTSFEAEYRTIAKDKKIRWVIARGKVEVDSKGEPLTFPGALVDITERKAAEEWLNESRQGFQDLANSMPQLVWITDAKGNVEFFNSRWYEYTGTTAAGESSSNGWIDVLHPGDISRTKKTWKRSLETGELYEIEFRLRDSTGNYRWFIGRSLPTISTNGAIKKWYGTCTDIDDQKRRASLQHFLSEATKVLTSSLNYDETLRSIARIAVPRVADWCSIEVLNDDGQLEQVAVAHKDPTKVKWALELRKQQGPPNLDAPSGVPKVLRTGQSEFLPLIPDEVLVAASKNKEELEILRSLGLKSAIIAPLRIKDKVVGGITFIISDNNRLFDTKDLEIIEELANRASLAMTNSSLFAEAQKDLEHRKKLEDQLRLANEELERRVEERTAQLEDTNLNLQRSNQELQDFAYVASHDLQEPLRKIQAFGNLLQEEYAKELGEGSDYLKRMRSAAARMSALIEDILSFSRVTTMARSFTKVNLSTVASEVLEDLETRISDTGATVEVGKLPTIEADEVQMRQLLQNLIANAIKFHKPDVKPVVTINATIEISQSSKIKYCRIIIQDNGVGFDEKYLDRIFAVFQRLHTRDSYEGTGIGLAVCRKIVERHGGSITAESIPGKGASFIIDLPYHHRKGDIS